MPCPSSRCRSATCGLHFIQVQGVGPKPLPLLLSHGWPGSIWEFHQLIPLLTDPGAHGGRPRRRVHGRGAVASRLHVLVQARPAASRHRRDRGRLRPADDRRPRLRALRRAGRRLGRVHHLAPRPLVSGSAGRHPRDAARRAARSGGAGRADRRGEGLPRGTAAVGARGDRLPVDPGHEAADARLRAHRLAGGARGVDRGEVPDVERLRAATSSGGSARTSC